MKKIVFIVLLLSIKSFAISIPANTLIKEWTYLRSIVRNQAPQGNIGGYYNYYNLNNSVLLWKISDDSTQNEVIRFFTKRSDGTIFAITYYKSDTIIPDKTVLRRFIGTEPTGWINHTVDLKTGKYLGSQGGITPRTKSEKMLMKSFLITDF